MQAIITVVEGRAGEYPEVYRLTVHSHTQFKQLLAFLKYDWEGECAWGMRVERMTGEAEGRTETT